MAGGDVADAVGSVGSGIEEVVVVLTECEVSVTVKVVVGSVVSATVVVVLLGVGGDCVVVDGDGSPVAVKEVATVVVLVDEELSCARTANMKEVRRKIITNRRSETRNVVIFFFF